MKTVLKIFDMIISIGYWIISIVGCLVVIPCRLISAIMVAAGFLMWFSEGISYWRNGMPYFVAGIVIYAFPIFLSVFLADFLLMIKDKIYLVRHG